MQTIAKFEKVSEVQFIKDWMATFLVDEQSAKAVYEQIKLPKRATIGSAGYDFYAPQAFTLKPQMTIKIPTGIRVTMNIGWVLQLFPRSSLGFKYRLQFDNTIGIIDSDYYHSDNEGHIFAKLTNDTNEDKILNIQVQEAMLQGIFLPFGITIDDDTQTLRNGGFGSTNA